MTDKQLFEAVSNVDCNYLTALLSRRKNRLNPKDEGGQTLLHVAAGLGSVQMAKILLQNRNTGGMTDKNEMFGQTPVHTACLFDQTNMVNFLLDQVDRDCLRDFLSIADNNGWTCLHHVARNGNEKLCMDLIRMGANLSAVNKMGKQPIHYAASEGHRAALEVLLDSMGLSAIQTPAADKNGMNILHWAAKRNQQPVFLLLRDKAFPPIHKCEFIYSQAKDLKESSSLAEEVAKSASHKSLGSLIQDYRQTYEAWLQDMQEVEPLDRVKLCIIGEPGVGKSCLRVSLGRGLLQAALLPDLPGANDQHTEHSAGIVISNAQIENNNFVIWDFAGQLDNYVTHQLFMTTESTMYVAMVNICHDPDELRLQLMKWLKLIKVRNIGLSQYVQDPQYGKRDMFAMKQPVIRPSRTRTATYSVGRDEAPPLPPKPRMTVTGSVKCTSPVDRDESWPLKIPVVIAGSHFDVLTQGKSQEEIDKLFHSLKAMADGLHTLFWPFLDIVTDVIPLNCLKARSDEMQKLKLTLDQIRLSGIQYPRVIKTCTLRMAQYTSSAKDPEDKVIAWNKAKKLLLEANGILSDKQIEFILRIMHNTGHIVYLHNCPLADDIFTDPAWLCGETLGPLLAPQNFKEATLSKGQNVYNGKITESEFRECFANKKSQYERVEKLLTHLHLCWKDKVQNVYVFPGFSQRPFDAQENWIQSPDANKYSVFVGRSLLCSSDSDLLAPGFVSRLAVYMQGLNLNMVVWKDCFMVEDPGKVQCLLELARESTALEVRARTRPEHTSGCLKLLESLQDSMSRLIRLACPNIFINLAILSSGDIRHNRWPAHAFKLQDVLQAEKRGARLENPHSREQESTLDLLYCGSEDCKAARSGELTRITYIPDSLIKSLELLLTSEDNADKDWKALAKIKGFGDYLQILSHKEPNHVKYLLRKWGENPKWTLESLIIALDSMDRNDVALYVKSFFLTKDIDS